ncbi:DUF5994 family protein [Streptomyces peucetius]|uniref:DUF5994 family protein n=1 Tax=Streptomyces peucetius TaxID=1950 RepID=UPI0039B0DBD8
MPVSFLVSNDTGRLPARTGPETGSRDVSDHLSSPATGRSFGAPTARLALKPESPSPGHAELDGAWWPRSRDLTHELLALADVLVPLRGRITHITVNPRHWPILPRKIFANDHVVQVGWFTSEQDPHKIVLLSCTAGRCDLLVIPPEIGAPLGRPADGRRARTLPADDRDRPRDGGTGRRNFLVVRNHHRPARPTGGGDVTVVVAALAVGALLIRRAVRGGPDQT